jgi:hypothetical protein
MAWRGHRAERRELERGIERRPTAMKQELVFIIIGAQKSGTTSLLQHLRRRPDTCPPTAKQMLYFGHDAIHGRD